MNILSEDFINRLRESIVSIIRDSFQVFMNQKLDQTRYLQRKDAIKYIGGISNTDFKKLVDDGIPEIQIEGTVRYDKEDIDTYMAKHKF